MRDRIVEETNAYLDRQEKALEKYPICVYCGERIQDDYYFEIDGEHICEDCLKDNFRHSIESYID